MRNIITIALLINAAVAAFAILATTSACTAVHKEPAMPASTTPSPAPIATTATTVAPRTGYADINGVRYYYEIHGTTGEPVLLLHGGLMSTDSLAPLLPTLTATHQVIAVDLHGHGRTSLGTRPMRMEDMADDLAILLAQLHFPRVDAVGYSLGGGVAFRLAAQHPTAVRRLVIISAPFSRDGWYPEMLPQQAAVNASMADSMKQTPMYTSYAAIAPNPADFPILLDRIGVLMRTPYDWSADARALPMPTMLIAGDADMVTLDHLADFYHLLGGALRDAGWMREHISTNRLAILPDATHYDILESPALPPTLQRFLAAQP